MRNLKLSISLLLLIGLALVFRIYNLTSLPVFADEAIYIRWAQIMINEATLRFIPLSDGKQPLFMWVMMAPLKIFSDPLMAGRVVSVLTGIGGLIGVVFASYLIFKSTKASLITGLLYAVSPIVVFFDRMALVDSMLAMFGVWTFFFAVLTVKTKRMDMAILTGFALGGAFLTKSPALFFALLLPLTWVLADWPKNVRQRVIHLAKLMSLSAVSYAIAFAMYNILRLGPNFHLLSARNFDYVYPYAHILQSPFDPLKGHLGGIWSYFVMLVPGSVVFLTLISIFVNWRDNFSKVFVLLGWFLIPLLVIAEYSKVVTARYILFVLPFMFILAGGAILTKKRLVKNLVVGLILIFVAHSLFINLRLLTNIEEAPLPSGERSGYLEEWTAGTGISQVAEYLKSQAKELSADAKIVVGTEGYFGTLPNGLEIYLEGVDNIKVVGVGLGINQIPTSLQESKEAGNKTYLVINSTRFQGDAEKLGLALIAAYPKAARRPGSREYQMYGPREELLFFELVK